jgi:hypothetical protein
MLNGAPKNFQLWWMRFIAYAMVYEFVEAISNDALNVNMPLNEAEVLDKSDDIKKMIEVKRHNAVAMANLSMVFTSEGTSVGLVYKAMNANWPTMDWHI